MANTPPKPPLRERSDSTLLEELCLELRHVGVNDYNLPDGDRVKQHIREVCLIHAELLRRTIDCDSKITVLSEETSWKMKSLLEDCLAYPAKQPYVRELDGIRRSLRCTRCGKAERPRDAKLFWFCESCMKLVALALKNRTECDPLLICRSYSPSNRCPHADADTPLAFDWPDEQYCGVCEICVRDEIARRQTLPTLD